MGFKPRVARVLPAMRFPAWVVIFIMTLALYLPIASAKSSWKYCSPNTDYKVRVKGVVVDPDPVVRGSDALFEVPAVTGEPIKDGNVLIEVYYLGVPVYKQKSDLCIKTSCPIEAGQFTLKNTQGLPGYTPVGPYRLDMQVQAGNGEILTCVRINFRIVKSALQPE